MLKMNAAGTILKLAEKWWPTLPKEVLTGELRTKIQKGLEQVSDNNLLAMQWSRRIMQSIVSLDEAFSDILQHERMKVDNTSIMWKSIRAIYACDEDFQQSLGLYLNGLHPDSGDSSQAKISFDFAGETITLPGEERAGFTFDFKHFFPEVMKNQNCPGGPFSITPVIAIFACLQGQLRAIAWRMSLSAKHLRRLDDEIKDICYVSMYKFHWPTSGSPASQSGDNVAESWRTHDVESRAQSRQSPDPYSARRASSRNASHSPSRSINTV